MTYNCVTGINLLVSSNFKPCVLVAPTNIERDNHPYIVSEGGQKEKCTMEPFQCGYNRDGT